MMMIRSRIWAFRLALTTTALIATPGPEFVQSAEAAPKPSVAIGPIEGKNSRQVRSWVNDALKKTYEITDAEEVVPKSGSDAAYAKSAKSLGTDWIITGKADGKKLVLTVRSASDGKVVDTVEVAGTGPKLKKAVAKEVPAGLASAIGDEEEAEEEEEEAEEEEAPKKAKKPAPKKEEEAEEEEAEEEEAVAEEAAGEEATEEEEEQPADEAEESSESQPSPFPWAVLMGGLEAVRRDFTYHDQLADHYPNEARQLSDYHLPLQPGGFIALELYPVALFNDGFLSNIGLTFDFHQMLVTKSSYSREGEKAEFDNKTSRWSAGLRVRFPSETLELGGTAAYGVHKFFLAGDENNPIIPDVKYGFIKFGVDGVASFGKVAVGAKLGVRLLSSLGELESLWFQGATGTGLETGIFGRFSLSDQLGIVAGVDLLRYGFDFNAIPKDSLIAAGGAIDQYLIGYVGVRFALSSGATAASAGASASASASTEDTTEDSSSDDSSADEAEADEEEEEEEE